MTQTKYTSEPDWYSTDDLILVQAFVNGNNDAFEVLVKKYQAQVARMCYSILRSENGVSDVVQDVFLAAYRGLKKFRGDSAFKTWLYKIALHETMRHIRKRNRWKMLIEERDDISDSSEVLMVLVDGGNSPERLLLDRQKRNLIHHYLKKLSENHRIVLYLHYNEDLSVQEIGDILNIPVGSVKSRLHYARLRLKDLLSPVFEDEYTWPQQRKAM